MVSGFRWITPWLIGLAAALLAGPANAQGNLDAGKSPAQIFADTCSACHRRPQELKRASTSFLRSHYSTGSEEASAMANYLAGIPSEPRAVQQRRPPGPGAKETPAAERAARREPRTGEQKDQAKSARGPAGSSKGRRAANAEPKAPAPAAAPETKPPEPPPERPPPPALEPFEE